MDRKIRLKLDQIEVLVAKDFKVKYNSTALGFAWCLLVPTLMSLVYYFVFGIMMRWGMVENYLLYLVSGNFLWHFFAAVVNSNGSVLSSNAALLKKTSFDRRLMVWGVFFTEGAHFMLTIPVLIGIMACFKVVPQWWSIIPNLVVALIATAWLSVGVGYFYAALNLFFRDLTRIMGIVMMSWMYMSPVFIPISRVPAQYLWVYKLNPMASVLMIWRNIFYTPSLDPSLYLTPLVTGFVVFLLGRAVFRRMELRFAEMM